MTFKVVLTVQQSENAIASPTGIAAGKVRFTVTDASGGPVGSQDVDGLTATFGGLPTGTFTATAQQLDQNGAPIGDPVSASFQDGQVAPPAVTFNPPASLSAEVSEE